jgi:hypothetical protein
VTDNNDMSDILPIAPCRRSASAEAALRAEMARVDAMTIEERVKAVLSLPGRFAWLPPVDSSQNPTADLAVHSARSRK